MNPLLDKLRDWDAKQLYWLLAGVIALVVLVDAFTVMQLQVGLVNALEHSSVELQKNIDDLLANKQRLGQFREQLEKSRARRHDFEAMIHRKDDVPAVLKTISSVANEYGVKIDQLTPQPVEVKPLVQNEDGRYFAMTISIKARAGYHPLGRFLARLEREKVFWKLEQVRLNADKLDSQRHEIGLDMRIILLEK